VFISLLPIVVGLWAATRAFGGTVVPWRPNMVDLDVYRRAGGLLLEGGNIYDLPGQLPFLYPPFAALLAVPLALLPTVVVEIGWTVSGVLAVLAVLHRFGLSGLPLSLVGSGTVLFVTPVSQTLGFGQLGIFLVALVLLDLAPGPRVLGARRLLPQGTLTAVAAAIKLTPAIFLLYLLASGRRRPALVMIGTGLAVTLASAAVSPATSLTFWGRLAHGDTGLGHSIIYYTNQSVMADIVRIFGLGPRVALAGLAASGVVALLGVWAAAWWHRLGEVQLAVCLCGLASLLASPVSWLHHFVWIVPLGLSMLRGLDLDQRWRPSTTDVQTVQDRLIQPSWFQLLVWVFIGWVVAAPFSRLPNGADVELTWTWQQNALASTTAVLGVAVLVGSVALAARRQRLHAPRGELEDTASQG
jgi:alpha-1,2-mannosyltransferase